MMRFSHSPAVPMGALFCLLLPLASHAESGFYVGAGLGASSFQVDEDDAFGLDLDGNDFAWKVFGGYNVDLPFIDLGVEGGYMDLGAPTVVDLDATGWTAYAVGAVDAGPFAVFAKVGVVAWDLESANVVIGGFAIDDDGVDVAFGGGARVELGPVHVRGEAEFFAIEEVDTSFLLSLSAVWQF